MTDATTDKVNRLLQGDGRLSRAADLAGRATQPEPEPRVNYRVLTFEELMAAKFELQWLVEHIAVDLQTLLIAGPMKSMKSSILADLALSIALGRFFLGKFRVPTARKVLLMTGEGWYPMVQEVLRRVARAAGFDGVERTVGKLIVSEQVPRFGDPDHLAALERLFAEHEVEVLGVDPLYWAMPGADAGNIFIQAELLRGVVDLCQRNGVSLILCHHTTKRAGDDNKPLKLSDVAWAGFAEFARQWMLVNRREPYADGSGLHRLHLKVGGQAGHGGYWALDVEEGTRDTEGGRFWTVTVADAETAQAAKVDADTLRTVLGQYPNGETRRALRETLSSVQKAGLPSVTFGRCKYVLGADVLAFFAKLAAEQHTNGKGDR